MSDHATVTISVPRDLLREARHLAVDRGVSLSRFVATLLEEQIRKGGGQSGSYEEAAERGWRLLETGFDLGTHGKATWTRDELHER